MSWAKNYISSHKQWKIDEYWKRLDTGYCVSSDILRIAIFDNKKLAFGRI